MERVVAFLAGPEATDITGATINVDGGWNAWGKET